MTEHIFAGCKIYDKERNRFWNSIPWLSTEKDLKNPSKSIWDTIQMKNINSQKSNKLEESINVADLDRISLESKLEESFSMGKYIKNIFSHMLSISIELIINNSLPGLLDLFFQVEVEKN